MWHKKPTFSRLPALRCAPLAIWLVAVVAAVSPRVLAAAGWADAFFPYRLSVKLIEPAEGETRIAISPEEVATALKPVSIDRASVDTLALDRVRLFDTAGNEIAGGFELVATGETLPIHGNFSDWSADAPSYGWGALPADSVLESIAVDGELQPVLSMRSSQVTNRRLVQRVTLEPGRLYLLEYWIRVAINDGNLTVALHDPAKRIFSEVPHSYYRPLTPDGQWVRQRVLYRPEQPEADLQIGLSFVGSGQLADVRLTPVEWQLHADFTQRTSEFNLYAVATAGHRMTPPGNLAVIRSPSHVSEVQRVSAEMADLNPHGVLITEDHGTEAWTVPTYLPIRAETLALTRPRREPSDGPTKAYVNLAAGSSASLLIALNTDTPSIRLRAVDSTIAALKEVHQLASIPVFDGYHPVAQQIEVRLDAMVPIDFEFIPANHTGIHVVLVTFSADEDAPMGLSEGTIRIEFDTDDDRLRVVDLPVRVSVSPAVVKPMRHFSALMGAAHFTAHYGSNTSAFESDNITVAEYHGYKDEGFRDTWIGRLSQADRDEPHKAPVRKLAQDYFHRMIDFGVQPEPPALFASYSYTVTDQEDDQPPVLSNWDFSGFDQAIDEIVIARDMPWVKIWHTNGKTLEFFQLADGTFYSLRDRPGDESAPWVKLPRDVYVQFLGDYFETLATHLEKKGILDRAVIIVDESSSATFPLVRDFANELRSRPHARHIRIGHTANTSSMYTFRNEDDETLMMESVLDLPMIKNDDQNNYFDAHHVIQPSNARQQQWVYYVATDHLSLDHAGLSTLIAPLKLRPFGVKGWYLWASVIWSMPYEATDLVGFKGLPYGPLINPWINPYYHHGHGMLSFFYPPDPSGPASSPIHQLVPSYRLALVRDGILIYALLDIAEQGEDDAGKSILVDPHALQAAQAGFGRLWTDEPVRWYLSYSSYQTGYDSLWKALLCKQPSGEVIN